MGPTARSGHPGGTVFSHPNRGFRSEDSISCRDAQDGILLLPRDDALHVNDVHGRYERGARLSRDCRPHGVWLLPYGGGLRARDAQQL
jgi:hypothetical protein